MLQTLNDFEVKPLDTNKKLVFVFSILFDNIVNKYKIFQYSSSIEVPKQIQNNVLQVMHKIRSYTGDSKLHILDD